jgi:hypothetical protein
LKKDLNKMTITFSPGQYFHPVYGWMNEAPQFNNKTNRNTIVETLGDDDRLKPGDALYDLLNGNSKWDEFVKQMESSSAQKTADPDPAYIYEKKDLSYFMDGYFKSAGAYSFEYKGNTVTANVNFNDSSIKSYDPFERYEQHRASILGLSTQGYNNEAIGMLLNALNKEFLNSQRMNIINALGTYSGYIGSQADEKMRAINSEYLRIRSDGCNSEETLKQAVQNLKDNGVLNRNFKLYDDESDPYVVNGQRYHTLELAQKVRDRNKVAEAKWAAINAEEAARNAPLRVGVTKADNDYSIDPSEIFDPFNMSNPATSHIRDIDSMKDYSSNTSISDIEKEARSLSVVFRVRGDTMVDYAKRYEELSNEIDSKFRNGQISQAHYDRYRADLNTAFIKTFNLNIIGQAQAAGLSEAKAKELAAAFSEEYIKLHDQTTPEERNADKMANEVLKKLASQGWPEFSLYSIENRATVADDDPWYKMLSEDALYYMNKPQPYENW